MISSRIRRGLNSFRFGKGVPADVERSGASDQAAQTSDRAESVRNARVCNWRRTSKSRQLFQGPAGYQSFKGLRILFTGKLVWWTMRSMGFQRPSTIRMDQMDRNGSDEFQKSSSPDSNFPVIVHFGIRPSSLTYNGNPEYFLNLLLMVQMLNGLKLQFLAVFSGINVSRSSMSNFGTCSQWKQS